MDDANWISDSLQHTEDILSVADKFYEMTRAAINREKTKLLTNKKSSKPINLKFGHHTIAVSPETTSVRFLGVLDPCRFKSL